MFDRGRLRTILVVLLVVLTCLGVVLTAVTWWLHYTALNTDGYMKVVGPVAQDPEVRADLSQYLSNEIIAATDLQAKTEELLPPNAAFLSGPITEQVEGWITSTIERVLASEQAYDLWISVNRFAHEKAVGLLRGENEYTYVEGEDVKVNTLPLLSQAMLAIDERAPRLFGSRVTPPVVTPDTPVPQAIEEFEAALGRDLPSDFGQFTLVSSQKVQQAQTLVRVFDAVVIVLPIVTVLLGAGALVFARRRLRVVVGLALGSAVALLTARIAIKRLSDAITSDLTPGAAKEVVSNIMTAAVGPIVDITLWLVLAGIVIGLVAWAAGKPEIARPVVAFTRAGQQRLRQGGAASDWTRRNADWLRLGGVVVTLVALLLAVESLTAVALVLAAFLLYEAVVSWLAGLWPFVRRPTAGT